MIVPSEICEIIKKKIQNFEINPEISNEGVILNIKDGVVQVYGLTGVLVGEVLRFQNGIRGIALNLEQDSTGVIVLGRSHDLTEGQIVKRTNNILSVPVGKELLGRSVNALGEPLDGLGPINTKLCSPIEKIAPGVIDRKPVHRSLATGIKSIDSMIPIGCGQRELIIGDRQTGKTSIAIDTIINQRGSGVKCIYVAIGQKTSAIANIKRKLIEFGAMDYTIIVAATASDSAAEQYIAPYAGCAMGEFFRDNGEDALIIYDDLTKHAWAYRQISLLLRRPPGREAYPGDIFYLHSRLLERASQVNENYIKEISHGEIIDKVGSLTALPIVETQEGDLSSFIPTNIISITDGQIFLETDLFNAGIRPAINVGLSVSRVGGAAQTDIIKKFSSGLRLALAQYRELEAFAQFASELDDHARKQLERGQRAVEILKQPLSTPLSIAHMAISLLLVEKNILDDIDLNKISEFEHELHLYFSNKHSDILDSIKNDCQISEKILLKLQEIISTFKNIKFT